MVPTEKFVSTILDPSSGSKATLNPPSTGPPMSCSSGTSSEQAFLQKWEYSKASKRSLLASISTASCSSPKEFTHCVPPQDAVLTLKAMVLIASPMQINNLMSPLSGVAFVRNSSRLSPISHLVTWEEFFAFVSFSDDLGAHRNDSPNRELDFRLCQDLTYCSQLVFVQPYECAIKHSCPKLLSKYAVLIMKYQLSLKAGHACEIQG
uniref:Sedoheptulose-1 family protein n=1 Tax=Rhizophora mucronata TaxID=61149 RepID=A0A2P2L884_RHIMU